MASQFRALVCVPVMSLSLSFTKHNFENYVHLLKTTRLHSGVPYNVDCLCPEISRQNYPVQEGAKSLLPRSDFIPLCEHKSTFAIDPKGII